MGGEGGKVRKATEEGTDEGNAKKGRDWGKRRRMLIEDKGQEERRHDQA
jgi:hypothetical protein